MKKRLNDFLIPFGGAISTIKRIDEDSDSDFKRVLNSEMSKGEFVWRSCERMGYFGLVCSANVGYAYLFGYGLSRFL